MSPCDSHIGAALLKKGNATPCWCPNPNARSMPVRIIDLDRKTLGDSPYVASLPSRVNETAPRKPIFDVVRSFLRLTPLKVIGMRSDDAGCVICYLMFD